VKTQDGGNPLYNEKIPKMNGMIAGNPILVDNLLSYIK
ncbi:MAG: 3'(2'),5'-bisphosphate nucleotidase CysQ, partial [Rhodobacterales bacterium]